MDPTDPDPYIWFLKISVYDPNPIRFGLPVPFHKTDPGSKWLAKIIVNSLKKSTKITKTIIFKIWLHVSLTIISLQIAKFVIYWSIILLIEKKCKLSWYFLDFRSDLESDPEPDPLFTETDPYQNETDTKHGQK